MGLERVDYKFVVTKSEFDEYLNQSYEFKKNKIIIPGFRKGRAVSRNQIEAIKGKSYFYNDAAKLYVKRNLKSALKGSYEYVSVDREKEYTVEKNEDKYVITVQLNRRNGFENLKKEILSFGDENDISKINVDGTMCNVCFIAASNMDKRARQFWSVKPDIKQAIEAVSKQFCQKFYGSDIEKTVIKMDVVTNVICVPTSSLSSIIAANVYDKFFRYGIAFDSEFKVAFSEQLLNAYQMIDYKERKLSLERINKMLGLYGMDSLESIPEYIYLFETQGYILDVDDEVHMLYGGAGNNTGRRVVDEVDDKYATSLVKTAAEYLMRQINPDGSFIYGYYPSFDKNLSSYNILRHCGTLWSMLCADNLLHSQELKNSIFPAIKHFIDVYTDYKDEDIAYLVERKADEIKLGGNGVAILVLAKYMENYNDVDFTDLIRKYANGLVSMQDSDTGKYVHVLNSYDYTVKEEERTVYYDGESTYALCQAYELTGDKKYLECARKALDYQIENNYVVYRDHWLAYAINNYIKHDMSEKYVDFALRNAWENLEVIFNQTTSYHTYEELLTMTMDSYLMCLDRGYHSDYFDSLDVNLLIDTIRHRAWHMLDGYWYPEYAMFMGNPNRILGSFFVRHDGFRTRIDDDQHFIDGYVKFCKLYPRIVELEEEKTRICICNSENLCGISKQLPFLNWEITDINFKKIDVLIRSEYFIFDISNYVNNKNWKSRLDSGIQILSSIFESENLIFVSLMSEDESIKELEDYVKDTLAPIIVEGYCNKDDLCQKIVEIVENCEKI